LRLPSALVNLAKGEPLCTPPPPYGRRSSGLNPLENPALSLKSKGGKIKSADLKKVILKTQLFNITFKI